jgi:hypothetical protein
VTCAAVDGQSLAEADALEAKAATLTDPTLREAYLAKAADLRRRVVAAPTAARRAEAARLRAQAGGLFDATLRAGYVARAAELEMG